MTTSPIAIINGRLTPEGEKLRDEIAAEISAYALKTDDPRAYVAAWSENFQAAMAQLNQGGAR